MSDDIERLKKVLEDMRVSNDTLAGQVEVAADIIGKVVPVSAEANPEGYGDLKAIAQEFQPEFNRLVKLMFDHHLLIAHLHQRADA